MKNGARGQAIGPYAGRTTKGRAVDAALNTQVGNGSEGVSDRDIESVGT